MAKKKSNGGGGDGGGGGEKNKENHGGDLNIVLKLHLHCEGCITKIRKSIMRFPGIRTVDFDGDDKVKVLAAANVDVQKLRDTVERKTGKKVEIVSPQPKKDKDNKNPQKGNDKPKEPSVKTVMLKVSWHCYGCGERIQRTISSFNGVYELSIDKEKDQVKVTGKMDPNKLVEELRKRLKRPVEILPEKKEKANEKDKKEKDSGAGGGEAAAGGGGGGARIDHYCVNCSSSLYGPVGPGPGQLVNPCYVYPPQLFSDENPNSCSVM